MYSQELPIVLLAQLKAIGGEYVGEEYLDLASNEVGQLLQKLKRLYLVAVSLSILLMVPKTLHSLNRFKMKELLLKMDIM